jgi:hypothetical protein
MSVERKPKIENLEPPPGELTRDEAEAVQGGREPTYHPSNVTVPDLPPPPPPPPK